MHSGSLQSNVITKQKQGKNEKMLSSWKKKGNDTFLDMFPDDKKRNELENACGQR